jgi:hypothetical protein
MKKGRLTWSTMERRRQIFIYMFSNLFAEIHYVNDNPEERPSIYFLFHGSEC